VRQTIIIVLVDPHNTVKAFRRHRGLEILRHSPHNAIGVAPLPRKGLVPNPVLNTIAALTGPHIQANCGDAAVRSALSCDFHPMDPLCWIKVTTINNDVLSSLESHLGMVLIWHSDDSQNN